MTDLIDEVRQLMLKGRPLEAAARVVKAHSLMCFYCQSGPGHRGILVGFDSTTGARTIAPLCDNCINGTALWRDDGFNEDLKGVIDAVSKYQAQQRHTKQSAQPTAQGVQHVCALCC